MLRVDFEDVGDTVTIRLQGRFVGPFAKDTRDLVTHCKIPPRLVVNLSEVTFVDAAGEEILSWLARIGGRFIADNCYPQHVCERLRLPLVPMVPMVPKRRRGLLPGDVTRSRTF